jgi:hypothetical protein
MLPDLDSDVDVEIVKENLNAVQAIYFAYMLEEMRAFQVVERIAQLYQQGSLPLGQGAAAEALRRYALAGNRLSSAERAHLYVKVLGARGVEGAPGGTEGRLEPNRDFLSLWLRFLVSVAMYSRQRGVQDLLVPRTPANADVRRAARRLAANASLHGWGMAHFAARLTTEVERLTSLLSDPEIERSFGARDMWSVLDQVNRLYLDGAVNVARYRTQAEAGRVVLQWLTANADQLGAAGTTAPGGTPGGGTSTSNEDLASATEQWLGASGVTDELIDEYSQPGESPTLICPPVDLPAIDLSTMAQDLLGAVGLLAGGLSGSDAAERLRGVVALFHGAAGTGKTLAAHVLAAALSRDIVRVDLSRAVSRHIGETEKNLDAIFARAERSDAILFFDEADALFGRRTEVKDSHDRYANLDVAAFLQRIEAYYGVVVLASNLLPKESEAEADDTLPDNDRRRRQVVRFPRPRRWKP